GNVFNFIINGKRVFARGANWVPADAFPSRVTAERYRKLLEMARRSNMNMLRVWGGGIYESDVFYDLCDRLGIMVWQEFMFACAPYPQNERFLRGVEEEARAVVRRLRNHPSIVIWCGDNEVDWSYTWWGRSDWAQNRINRAVLKNVVEELDPTRPYMPSSPFSPDPAADPNSPDQGDRHNWDVWHGKQPYRAYARDRARFCSEFGMQASPAAETMREVIPPEQWSWPPGDSWAHHNLDLQKLSPYMEEFGGAQCVEDFIRLSQLTQATVLKFAIEHFRRSKFACGGCMFWQFNEPWPTVCWSVVDYFGRPKMGYYYVKRAYSNVLVSLKEEGEGRLSLWIVNDGLEGVEGDLIVERRDFAGRRIWSDRRRVRVPPNSVLKAADVRIPEMPLASMRTEYFSARLAKGSQVISENSHFLVRERDLVLPEARLTVRARVDRSDGGDVLYKVEVGSDSYARVVKVDLGVDAQYSDNYFDVPANESREILVRVRRGVPVSRVTVKAHNSAESSCDLAPMGPLRPG
ncbi:TPA: hypothetical protein EYP44_02960, partial [Candidatus Bathyarchaeota archaeon]|nr:hypothetical protein [Candidatus Bathyarchaeota archaeon]